jgi:hypothetical protein
MRKRAEDMATEDVPGVGESTAPEGVPEDAVEIDAKVYTTESGDLLVIPTEPLTVEGLEEPLEEIEISLVDEVDEGGGEGEPAPADLVTEEPKPEEAMASPAAVEPVVAAEDTEADAREAEAIMAKLNSPDTKTSFFKGGSADSPKWFVVANGDLVATIAYSAIPDESGKFKEFFAGDNFPAKVHESARVIGWDTVLANFKAELFTKKSMVVAPEKVDHAALRADIISQVKNDLGLAYSAMTARLRSNPFAAHLFEATQQSGMEAPEVFTAAVIERSATEFITELADVLDEVAGMSESVKAEFKTLIARTTVPMPTVRSKYTADQSFMATLQDNSIPVASTQPSSRTSRFSGIL